MAYDTIDNSSNGSMLPTVQKSENSRHVTRRLQQLSNEKQSSEDVTLFGNLSPIKFYVKILICFSKIL